MKKGMLEAFPYRGDCHLVSGVLNKRTGQEKKATGGKRRREGRTKKHRGVYAKPYHKGNWENQGAG